MQTFPAQMAETTKFSITRKPYNKFLHTDNFQFIHAFRCLYPAKTAKNSYSAKSKITYTAKKKKTKKPFSSYSNTNVFFNFAQNNIGPSTFFSTKLTPNPEKLTQNNN